MKKVGKLLVACLLLTGCQKKVETEENAVLKVAVHDEEYGNSLKEMWEVEYPNSELQISVVDEKSIEEKLLSGEALDYDVYWIEDEMVPVVLDSLVECNQTQVKLNTRFNEFFGMKYLPLFAKGESYFMLDIDKIEADGLSVDMFSSMESIGEIESGFYYLDDVYYTSSFLTSNLNYFPGKDKSTINFTGNSFREALPDYRRILDLVGCDDPASYDNWFMSGSYYSGFVNDGMQMYEDEEVNGGKFKIMPLPTIGGRTLYTRAISYGYVGDVDCEFPNAQMNLLRMIHSKDGVQLLCDNEMLVPLILENEMKDFSFGSEHIEEKVVALNYAVSRNFIGVENKEGGAVDFLYLDEVIQQLRDCDLSQVNQFQRELDEQYQAWLK